MIDKTDDWDSRHAQSRVILKQPDDSFKAEDRQLDPRDARIHKLEETLRWIDAQRYADRDTFHEGNAFTTAQRLSAKLVEVYDRARVALEKKA